MSAGIDMAHVAKSNKGKHAQPMPAKQKWEYAQNKPINHECRCGRPSQSLKRRVVVTDCEN
jgi:hypothetical protein